MYRHSLDCSGSYNANNLKDNQGYARAAPAFTVFDGSVNSRATPLATLLNYNNNILTSLGHSPAPQHTRKRDRAKEEIDISKTISNKYSNQGLRKNRSIPYI